MITQKRRMFKLLDELDKSSTSHKAVQRTASIKRLYKRCKIKTLRVCMFPSKPSSCLPRGKGNSDWQGRYLCRRTLSGGERLTEWVELCQDGWSLNSNYQLLVRAALCRRCLTAVGHYFAYFSFFFLFFLPPLLNPNKGIS